MRKVFIVILLAMGISVHAQNKDHNLEVAKNLEVFNSIYKHLDLLYVDTLNAKEVVGNAINGMLRSLDPYTVYYSEDKTNELRTMLTGKYAGIGSIIRWNSQISNSVIEEPYEGMPAAEAGLRKGDVILSIDGESMKGKDNAYVSDHLRGDAGTTFELKIRRPSTGKEMRFKITRRSIQMPAVPYYGVQQGGIGYIKLNEFTENSAKIVRNAFIDMRHQQIKGLILDLRNNGGGSELEAANLVNLFVPKGVTVVSNRGKLKRANHDYKTTSEPIDTVIPIVVMVNGNSASSAEIVTGALQDMDRAVVLGTKTYGKGLVQMPIDLPYNSEMKVTTSRYYIPSGRCIQARKYRHNDGGSSEVIADSTKRKFYTLNGREVLDAGGITPDVVVEGDSLPNIAYYLAAARDSNEVLLNYEVDYIAKHPTVAQPVDFELSDEDYAEFKKRVLDSGFTYDRTSEKFLKDLEQLTRFEGYYDDAKPEFEALKKKLSHNVAKDLEYNKQAIKNIINNDLMAAYYFQRGATQNSLRHDKQMDEAMKLIADGERYAKILNPKK
ncbi:MULTISPECIES: S41 family peptidase [Prevotella]|uniref:S41 family peptidase n=1 Tax=Prevotella TaxID=838 RepID=UPI000B96102D|nr:MULTISPECIES: S41 family peptidase [Prevotella]MCF2637339.1 S41 family peptidase [Prevotella dentalis]OYP72308.1 peptidase S41 [Prevotella sp. P4-67]